LPLRLALDSTALAADGQPQCGLLIVRVEFSRPLIVDVVAAHDGTPEDVLRRLFEVKRAELPCVTDALGPVALLPGGSAGQQKSPTASLQVSLGSAPSAGVEIPHISATNAAASVTSTWPAAAVEQADVASMKNNRNLGRTNGGRAGMFQDNDSDDEEGDGPNGPAGGHNGLFTEEVRHLDDYDRPPTPAPRDFENIDAPAALTAAAAAAATAVPCSFVSVQHSPRSRGSSSAGSGVAQQTNRGGRAAAAAARTRRRGPTASSSPTTARTSENAKDGLFLLKGIGWCDELGNVVAPAVALVDTRGPGRPATLPRGKSLPRAGVPLAVKRPAKNERDVAWDSIPGI